jgi:hypothetical protein
MQQLHTHEQVIVEEFGRLGAVGPDAADVGGEMDDKVRLGLRQDLLDGLKSAQVIFPAAGDADVSGAPRAVYPQRRSPESRSRLSPA